MIESNWKFIGIDDANLLFDASFEKRADLGLPVIHHLLTTVRKSRMNILCCTQTPHQLGSSIHSNSALKIMFSQSAGGDVEFMHKSIGNLNQDQKDFSYKLGPRQIIIKNTLRYPIPILGVVPELPATREVTDFEIKEKNARILSQLPPVVPRQVPKPKQNEKSDDYVNDDLKIFLMAVNPHQYKKPSSEISKLGGFSAGTGSRLLKECVKRNLIKIIQIPFGKGRPKYPVLLPDAYKLLGIEEKKFYGKGAGYEHVLYQHLIAEHFKSYKPVIELNRNNKFLDVAIETNEYLIGIEVAVTHVHERENLGKDFQLARTDFVIVACKNEKVLKAVEKSISDLPEEMKRNKRLVLISELLTRNAEKFINEITEPTFL